MEHGGPREPTGSLLPRVCNVCPASSQRQLGHRAWRVAMRGDARSTRRARMGWVGGRGGIAARAAAQGAVQRA
eukprot:5576561-Lingulodinium_polyedra.AAC.1